MPFPTYTANIPMATDQVSVSQGQIQSNFLSISAVFDVNHVDFNAGADAGKHMYVTFPSLGAIPMPPFLVGELELFNIVNATTATNELYVQKGPGGTPIPMTASSQNLNGWSYLPSGILVKWGTGNATGIGSVSITNGPAFNNAFGAFVSPLYPNNLVDSNLFVGVRGVSTANLLVWCGQRTTTTATSVSFKWLVIGN